MPLLGFFSKKAKASKNGDAKSMYSTESVADAQPDSPTMDYVRPDRLIPSSPNGLSPLHPHAARSPVSLVYPTAGQPIASSSKLRLPFGRKNRSGGSTVTTISNDGHGERPSLGGLSMSDAELPAPRPSFTAYSDPNKALSTRSLPYEATAPPSRSNQKRPLFGFSKSAASTPSRGTLQNAKLEPMPADAASFNLKSFRHVRPPSPTQSASSSPSLSPPIPRPRPRGASTTSDSSQRISVAAFREAQARRSTAGSPVPSGRSPSPHGLPIRAPSPHGLPASNPRGQKPGAFSNSRRNSRYLSDSDESEEEEDSEDEYGQDEPTLGRKRTITQRRPGNQERFPSSRSEMGHGSESRINLDTTLTLRSRASHSTSSLAPNAAAQRATQLNNLEVARTSRHARDESAASNPTIKATPQRTNSSNSTSSSSDDDAPLSSLVPPRRPGSAMSSNSSRSNRSNPPKPLIDINTVVGKPPKSASASPSTTGFTPGITLLSKGAVSADPPGKFVSPPNSPVQSHSGLATHETVQAPRLTSLEPSTRTAPVRKESAGIVRTSSPEQMTTVEMGNSLVAPLPQVNEKEVVVTKKKSTGRINLNERLSKVVAQSTAVRHRRSSSDNPPPRTISMGSEGMADLASMLGGGVRLISAHGESDEEVEEVKALEEKPASSFKPIPIARRMPTPSFSVTSRPQKSSTSLGDRTSVISTSTLYLTPASTPAIKSITSPSTSGSNSTSSAASSTSTSSAATSSTNSTTPVTASRFMPRKGPVASAPASRRTSPLTEIPKQRTSTVPPDPARASGKRPTELLAGQRSSVVMPTSSSKPDVSVTRSRPRASMEPRPRSTSMMMPAPTKPFADSPASSIGDSSSGRIPLTPKDGSDIESSTMSGSTKRMSVNFEEVAKEKHKKELERRRNEAKASIELGNVVNGRGPILDDDEEMPNNQARMGGAMFGQPPGWPSMPIMNSPMMNMPPMMPMAAQMMGPPQMMSPAQFMPPMNPTDPAFFAAHQQAMMYAKQAYQMAVAQQAMAAAADEWERNSAVAYSTSGSVYGGGSGGWGTQSMYGGGARSEYGGGGGSWGTQSMYGGGIGSRGAYGGGARQSSGYFPPMPPMPPSQSTSSSKLPGGSRARTVSQPASPSKKPHSQQQIPSPSNIGKRRAAPPSSWRPGA